jgi:hypothetical protein
MKLSGHNKETSSTAEAPQTFQSTRKAVIEIQSIVHFMVKDASLLARITGYHDAHGHWIIFEGFIRIIVVI